LLHTPALTVIEDFGHHPTALAETLASFRTRFPDWILTAVFEPRSNTARVRTLQVDFAMALGLADEVFLGAVNRTEKLRDHERFDTEAVARQLVGQGASGRAFSSNPELLEALVAHTLAPKSPSRIVVFFTNGSFDGIIGRYAAAAKVRLEAEPAQG
jgi:UDP-N-acetylmuramate: L-alanyl-gamma-D-glutamyl-meso-diaminopimelate ligase